MTASRRFGTAPSKRGAASTVSGRRRTQPLGSRKGRSPVRPILTCLLIGVFLSLFFSLLLLPRALRDEWVWESDLQFLRRPPGTVNNTTSSSVAAAAAINRPSRPIRTAVSTRTPAMETNTDYFQSSVCPGCRHVYSGKYTCGEYATSRRNKAIRFNRSMSDEIIYRKIAAEKPECKRCDPNFPCASNKYWKLDKASPQLLSTVVHSLKSIPLRSRLPLNVSAAEHYASIWHDGKRIDVYFEYNPSLALLPDSVAARFISSDTSAGDRPVYLASYRVSSNHGCLPKEVLNLNDLPGRLTKVQNFLGLALLRADLTIVPESDVVIDLEGENLKWERRQRSKVVVDVRLFNIDNTIYLNMNGPPVFLAPIEIYPKGKCPKNYRVYNKKRSLLHDNEQIRLKNMFGNGIEVALERAFVTVRDPQDHKGKNFALFAAGQTNTVHVEYSPLGPHVVQSIDPYSFVGVDICTVTKKQYKQQWPDINVTCNDHGGTDPELRFTTSKAEVYQREVKTLGNRTVSNDLPNPTFATVDELWFEKAVFESYHGGACCVKIDSPLGKLNVGVGHTKIPYRPWMKRSSNAEKARNQPHHQYASFFYAFDPQPPFHIRARSGLFCLSHVGTEAGGDNKYASLARNQSLSLMHHTFSHCPKVHFVSGIVQHALDKSKIVIAYGINDCVPAFSEVAKAEIARYLFFGLDPQNEVASKNGNRTIKKKKSNLEDGVLGTQQAPVPRVSKHLQKQQADDEEFWSARNHVEDPIPALPEDEDDGPPTVAYIVTLTKCLGSRKREVLKDPGFKARNLSSAMDGAAVLLHSVRRNSFGWLPQTEAKTFHTSEGEASPPLLGGKGGRYRHRMYAIVGSRYSPDKPGQPGSCARALRELGYHILHRKQLVPLLDIGKDNPNGPDTEFAMKMRDDGCCGESELLKLHSYGIDRHRIVVHLDLDSIVLQPMDALFDAMLTDPLDSKYNASRTSLPLAKGAKLPSGPIDVAFTLDYNMVSQPMQGNPVNVQGGFFVVKPNSTVLERYREILLKGEYTTFPVRLGWGSKMYGFAHGGMTFQGIVPYYYKEVAPKGEHGIAELDRCTYNQMADNPRKSTHEWPRPTPLDPKQAGYRDRQICRDGRKDCSDSNCQITPIYRSIVAHYAFCSKPWDCPNPWNGTVVWPTCRALHREWYGVRREFEYYYKKERQRQMKYYNGTLEPSQYLGYCNVTGASGYHPMVGVF